ncbi:MAG: RNA-binding S4 domain-containing protein [Candidatus Omnitrophica bacterium]|nr:RNA-binding S4 domain-containing protein [Candidatus Omnitrophota bacterium]
MNEIRFTLTTEFIELFKLLKITGLCESGGSAKYAVSESLVQVDGKVELRKAFKVRTGMRIDFSGQCIFVD